MSPIAEGGFKYNENQKIPPLHRLEIEWDKEKKKLIKVKNVTFQLDSELLFSWINSDGYSNLF